MPRPSYTQLEAKLKQTTRLVHEVLTMKEAESERLETKIKQMEARHHAEMTDAYLFYMREKAILTSELEAYKRQERDDINHGMVPMSFSWQRIIGCSK